MARVVKQSRIIACCGVFKLFSVVDFLTLIEQAGLLVHDSIILCLSTPCIIGTLVALILNGIIPIDKEDGVESIQSHHSEESTEVSKAADTKSLMPDPNRSDIIMIAKPY